MIHVLGVSRLYAKRRGLAGAFQPGGLVPLLIVPWLCAFAPVALAQGQGPEAGNESTNGLAGFVVQKGFKVELVASEPQVTAPVAMAFDEEGRLFVAEMPSPPEGRTTGRIRLLEDPEGDGTFTASSVFAEDVPWPTSIACYDGGIFVTATPDVLYLKDTRRKGVADMRRKVFSGFGGESQRGVDPGHLVTGLRWGADGRIHGLAAGIGGRITSLTTHDPLELGRNDFSFDPRSLEFRPEVGPGRSALAFDSRGRKFITDPDRPLRMPTYELAALWRNPFAPAPVPFVDVMSPATVVYTQVETPESTARTGSDAGASGTANAPGRGAAEKTNTNTTAPKSFTFARGTVFCGAGAFPSNYLDSVFIVDPVARVLHRATLRDGGLFPTAERRGTAERAEFLSSKDKGFYPTEVVNGPDGALYLADRTQTPENGRIYRIVPTGFKRPKVPQLGKLSTAELAVLLANPNAWHRETAARLLYERQDAAAASPLTNMVNNSRLPTARMQALRALGTLGALNEPVVLRALRDTDPRIRELGAYSALALFSAGPGSDELRTQLQTLATDGSINVRYQLAYTVGAVARPGRAVVLAEILFRDAMNPWFQSAVMSSLDTGAPELLKGLVTTPRYRSVPAMQGLLPELAQMIGARGRMDEVKSVLDFLYSTKLEPALTYGLLYNLGEGLRRTRSSLAAVDERNALRPFYDAALATATDGGFAAAVRVEATRLLGVSSYTFADIADWLVLLLAPRENPQVQLAAISALTHMADPRATGEILKRWQTLPVAVRREAITALLSRNDRAGAVLMGLQDRTIPSGDLSSTQLDFLRTYPDPVLSQRAQQLLGSAQFHRPQVLEPLKPAARLTGLVSRGREVFVARCASCHWASSGPGGLRRMSLAPLRTRAKEQILEAFVEPNAQVRPEDKTQVLETRDAEYFLGVLLNENPTAVTLLQTDGRPVVIPRSNIQAVRAQPWSLMPAGLEAGLSLQTVADLLEFVARAE